MSRSRPLCRTLNVAVPEMGGALDVSIEDTLLVFVNAEHVRATSWWARTKNRVVACFVRGYTHVEISFIVRVRSGARAGTRLHLSFVVLSGERVKMEVRPYDKPFFRIHRLGIAQHTAERLYDACVATLGAPFNMRGHWQNFVVPHALRYDAAGTAFFCAEHVTHVMRVARVDTFAALAREPYETTPQELFEHLRANELFNGTAVNANIVARDLVV